MYVSRLTFHTLPGKTQEVEQKLMILRDWVVDAGGSSPRVMRTHYGSLGPTIWFLSKRCRIRLI